MATNALMRPWNFETPDVKNALSPLLSGIDAGYRDRQQAVENRRADEQLGMQREQLGMQKQRYSDDRADKLKQAAGNLALLYDPKTDADGAKWKSFIATHPNAGTLDARYHNPETGRLAILADAGMAQAYLDHQLRRAAEGRASAAEGRAAATHTANMSQYQNMSPASRRAVAGSLGLREGTNEFNSFIASGQYSPGESMKLNIVPEGGTLVATDPRTGRHQTIVAGEQKVDATTKKAIDEADDFVTQNNAAIGSLNEALRLNDIAYDGLTAGLRSTAVNNTPLVGKGGASATVQLQNLITNQALQTLRSTFGGNPTEGERKILLDVAGSINMPAADRKLIYERALQMAQARLVQNQQKAQALRSNNYYKPGGQPPAVSDPINFAPRGATPAPAGGPQVGTVEQGYRFKGGDPSKPQNWEKVQ